MVYIKSKLRDALAQFTIEVGIDMKFAWFLTAVIVSVTASTDRWTDLRVTFAPNSDGVDVNSFWLVRPTLKEALAHGWVQIKIENQIGLKAVAFSRKDLGVNPLYDSNGFLAGVHVAQPAHDVAKTKPPISNPLKTSTNELKIINGVMQLTSTFLLVDPETLAEGGRTKLGDRIGNGLWLRDTESESGYWEVPIDIRSLNKTTPYTWQNCIPGMGLHYYYDMHLNKGDCSDFYPWFLTAVDGSVTGVGYQMLSKRTIYDRKWYEDANGAGGKLTVPNAPECLAEYAEKYGLVSIHFYFIPKPWSIKCNQATDSVVPIPGM